MLDLLILGVVGAEEVALGAFASGGMVQFRDFSEGGCDE